MNTKLLGNTGIHLPVIGLGTWQYRGGVEALRRGIELGANFIDTAEMDGDESIVGDAVSGQRDQVFIATKVLGSNLRYHEVIDAATNSLTRLNTDHIDLYQVHWFNKNVPIAETMVAMEHLVDQGRVRNIGVSNFSVSQLREAQEAMNKYQIVSNQVLYSLASRHIESGLMSYCEDNQITIIAYSPLDQGGLASRFHLRRRNSIKVLKQVAVETEKTMAQVALAWCISHSNVVAIPKTDKVERVEENCEASTLTLTLAQTKALEDAFR